MKNATEGSPQKKRNIARIEVDRSLCIGAATCIAIAGEVFELDAENKSVVKNPHGADEDTIRMAAEGCPTKAIKLFDDDGNQLYP